MPENDDERHEYVPSQPRLKSLPMNVLGTIETYILRKGLGDGIVSRVRLAIRSARTSVGGSPAKSRKTTARTTS